MKFHSSKLQVPLRPALYKQLLVQPSELAPRSPPCLVPSQTADANQTHTTIPPKTPKVPICMYNACCPAKSNSLLSASPRTRKCAALHGRNFIVIPYITIPPALPYASSLPSPPSYMALPTRLPSPPYSSRAPSRPLPTFPSLALAPRLPLPPARRPLPFSALSPPLALTPSS